VVLAGSVLMFSAEPTIMVAVLLSIVSSAASVTWTQ
jgi:hypothetical protein